MSVRPTASGLFFEAIKGLARAQREIRKQNTTGPSIQLIEAIRQQQEDHEERKRRISEAIAGGAKLSRHL
jgi:hypothetical protein